jgi:hypothetical protein
MLINKGRLTGSTKNFRIIYRMLKLSDVPKIQVNQNNLNKQIKLIKNILEDLLAATCIFSTFFMWLWTARGFGWL